MQQQQQASRSQYMEEIMQFCELATGTFGHANKD